MLGTVSSNPLEIDSQCLNKPVIDQKKGRYSDSDLFSYSITPIKDWIQCLAPSLAQP